MPGFLSNLVSTWWGIHIWDIFSMLLGLQRKQNWCLGKNKAPVYYKHLGSGSAHYFEVLQHFICSTIHPYHIFINILMCLKCFPGLKNTCLSRNIIWFVYLVKRKSAFKHTYNYLVQDMAAEVLRGREQDWMLEAMVP